MPGGGPRFPQIEQLVEVDCHIRQGDGVDCPSAEENLAVAAVRLSPPRGQGALVRMDEPNFVVAAPLVLRQLVAYVIATGRTGPHLDDERQRLGKDGKLAGVRNQSFGHLHGDDDHVGYEVLRLRPAHMPGVNADLVERQVELLLEAVT